MFERIEALFKDLQSRREQFEEGLVTERECLAGMVDVVIQYHQQAPLDVVLEDLPPVDAAG
jgi:hypothetical protein